MINAIPYEKKLSEQWDAFVSETINGHFMFMRGFMDYHSDRFIDHSIMFYDESDKLIAILPANLDGDILHSHQGLSFGGVLFGKKVSSPKVIDIFTALIQYSEKKSFSKIKYKRVPDIYYDFFSQDDLYALFLNDAQLIRCDLNSTVSLKSEYKYSKGRKWAVNKAKKEGLTISFLDDYEVFWKILTDVLSAHNAIPTHTLNEITMLKEFFPENIKLVVAKKDEVVVAGSVLFINKKIVHTQYMASSEIGREIGALDYLIDHLMKNEFSNKDYFNFGISTEDSGRFLNEGLLAQKIGFGAKTNVHNTYEISIK